MSLRWVMRSLSAARQISGQLAGPRITRPVSGQTRRATLGGGLAAAAWSLSRGAAADASAPAANGFVSFEAAPAHLQLEPPPAEAAATYAYGGAIPGPLLRV